MKVARIRLAGLTPVDRALVSVAALSLLALALELVWPHPLDTLTLEMTSTQSPQSQVPREPDAPHGPDIEGIIERPLFTIDRRPYVIPVEPPEAQEAPPQGRSRPQFELVGVMTTSNARIALIGANASSPVMKIKVGESIDGWTLETVKSDAVVLRNGEQQHSIALYAREEVTAE